MVNDYEIVPEKEFDALKNDVEKIKKDPIGTSVEGKALKESMDNLNDSINKLLTLFKTTAETLKSEEQENQVMTTKIVPLFEKVQNLESQNEKIAKGIVALAEMFEDLKNQKAQTAQSVPEPKKETISRNPYDFPSSPLGQKPQGFDNNMNLNNMNSTNMSSPSFGNEFSPFGQPTQGPQPLPRMDMPPPPQMPIKKKGLFGR